MRWIRGIKKYFVENVSFVIGNIEFGGVWGFGYIIWKYMSENWDYRSGGGYVEGIKREEREGLETDVWDL